MHRANHKSRTAQQIMHYYLFQLLCVKAVLFMRNYRPTHPRDHLPRFDSWLGEFRFIAVRESTPKFQ